MMLEETVQTDQIRIINLTTGIQVGITIQEHILSRREMTIRHLGIILLQNKATIHQGLILHLKQTINLQGVILHRRQIIIHRGVIIHQEIILLQGLTVLHTDQVEIVEEEGDK